MELHQSTTEPNLGKSRAFFNPWRLGLVGIFLLSVALYLPTLQGTPIWDDHGILAGKTIGKGSIEGAFTQPFNVAYFRPLTSLSYLLDRQLFGQSPFFYHQTNILLHALSAILAAWLALVVFKSRIAGFLAGLLFAVQPGQTAAVSWIGARTDLLGVVFAALFVGWLYVYLETSRTRWLFLSCTAFFLGLLAKEQLGTLFPLIPLAALYVGRRNWKSAGLITLPYLAACIGFVALWTAFYPEPFPLGWAGWEEQLRRIGATYLHYLGLLAVPTPVGMHALSLANYEAPWPAIAGGALLVASMAGAAILGKRNPGARFILLLLALAYLPISNIIPIPSLLVGPYRAAVAGIGVAVLLALGFHWLMARSKALGWTASAAYAAVCAGFCLWGLQSWSSELEFFAAVDRHDPHSVVNKLNVCASLLQANRGDQALREMDDILDYIYGQPDWRDPSQAFTLARDPQVVHRLARNQGTRAEHDGRLSHLFHTRAQALDQINKVREALAMALLSTRFEPRNAFAQCFVGELQESLEPGSGLKRLRIATRVGAQYYTTWAALGNQRLRSKDFEEAASSLERAFELQPEDGVVALSLARARLGLGDPEGCLAALRSARKGLTLPEEIAEVERRAKALLEHRPSGGVFAPSRTFGY